MRKVTKIWLIIATSLVLVGCIIFAGVMTLYKWDFRKLSTVRYETNNYEINEDYKNISVVTRTADVVLIPCESLKSSVVCYEQENLKHSVEVKDGTLVISVVDTRKWYEHIGISFGTSKITVYIPRGEYGTLSVKTSTGNIYAENVTADALGLCVSTGDISVSNVDCKNVTSSGNTGDISLKNVIATEKISINRSTGDIKLDRCDATEISVKTDTGKVVGSLLSEKVFIAETSTGKVSVPKTTTGGKCEITTSTGDIKIEVTH